MTEIDLTPQYGTRVDAPLVAIPLNALRKSLRGVIRAINKERMPTNLKRLRIIKRHLEMCIEMS
jgi:hypothetical protein